jgi:hypothetical protein
MWDMIDPAVCVGLLRDCHRLRAGALTDVVQCYLGTRNTALGGPGVFGRSHTHTHIWSVVVVRSWQVTFVHVHNILHAVPVW